MDLQARPMQPRDTRECAAIVAGHPVIGPRYGSKIQCLQAVWSGLLAGEAMRTDVYEEVDGSRIRLCGFGVGVFVSDDFIREIKTQPLHWFGPQLVQRISEGRSPVLADEQVREFNSGQGLNLIVWEACLHSEFEKRTDLFHLMVEAFLRCYRGFLLKEMITSQVESVPRLKWAVDAGGLYWDAKNASYTDSLKGSAEKFIGDPHIVGVTRKLEYGRLGSWVGSLFDYNPPRFGFAPSEQRLLEAALSAERGTDSELGELLGVSLSAIKKLWLSIYRRVTDRRAETLQDFAPSGSHERGKEKRRRLLAYVREHPEELRPVSHAVSKQQRTNPPASKSVRKKTPMKDRVHPNPQEGENR